jgi:hypothetical protein
MVSFPAIHRDKKAHEKAVKGGAIFAVLAGWRMGVRGWGSQFKKLNPVLYLQVFQKCFLPHYPFLGLHRLASAPYFPL